MHPTRVPCGLNRGFFLFNNGLRETKEESEKGIDEWHAIYDVEQLDDVLEGASDEAGPIALYEPRLDVLEKELIEEGNAVLLLELWVVGMISAQVQKVGELGELSELAMGPFALMALDLSELLIEVEVGQVFAFIFFWIAGQDAIILEKGDLRGQTHEQLPELVVKALSKLRVKLQVSLELGILGLDLIE